MLQELITFYCLIHLASLIITYMVFSIRFKLKEIILIIMIIILTVIYHYTIYGERCETHPLPTRCVLFPYSPI